MAPPPSPVTIVNVGYRSTNFWVVGSGSSRLLVDLGWPGTMGMMLATLERKGVSIKEITHGIATHYHPDHAGLAEELKRQGMRLLVAEEQVHAIALMKQWTKPQDHFVDITSHGNLTFPLADSRRMLGAIGIDGEVVHTPGHSDDSVSLVLDGGAVFTGDLTLPRMAGEDHAEVVLHSWRTLAGRGATTVYPGHGPVGRMPV